MKGPISWFASNRVAANLLMFMIIATGLLTISTITEEVFPELSANIVTVSVVYPGASPEEVEESLCIRIEEELNSVDGIKRLRSSANEGAAVVTLELRTDADARQVLEDVKTRVDAIDTFPEEAETPIVQELLLRNQVVNVAVHGPADELGLKLLGERVRDEISTLPGISQVELVSTRPYEISIEVSENALRQYNLTFDAVAGAVRRSSLDLPGGSLRTEGGEILVRTEGQAHRGDEYERLVLLTRPDGTRLLLGDVATVKDGFAETDQLARFDGQPAVLVQVFRVGDQSALELSDTVAKYVDEARLRLPEGISLTTWRDDALILRSRLDTLIRNGRSGLLLVFCVLAIFLQLRLAFWVCLGIPVSFLGAIALMPVLGVTINLLSLFAFIVVLGIVVDDAIVVAENIHAHRGLGKSALQASIDATQEVSTPVTYAVLTSVVAFMPMMFVPGTTGQIWRVIPVVVISCLVFSLIESKFILPAHLAREPSQVESWGPLGVWNRWQERFSNQVQRFIDGVYRPVLDWALRWRYATLAMAFATLFVTIGAVQGGFVKLTFMPPVEADFVFAALTMPQGATAEQTAAAVTQLEEGARELSLELDGKLPGEGGAFRHVMTSVGEQPSRSEQSGAGGSRRSTFGGSHLGEVTLELAPAELRTTTSKEIARRWREKVGAIPGATELTFHADLFSSSKAIDVELMGTDIAMLRSAAADLRYALASEEGVFDVSDSFRAGKQEIKLDILPAAEALGLSLADLARQVRQGFYGEEVQRVVRGRDDVKVMVRYPESGRSSLGDLDTMRIRLADGSEVPFNSVARASMGRGWAAIERADRRRALNVSADVDPSVVNANEIMDGLSSVAMPALVSKYPGLSWRFAGTRREQAEVLDGLFRGFLLALVAIYGLMAVPFKSYLQPLIIMTVIPFGLVGAIGGHVLMGRELSVLSMCGMVALTGVVVNDSLVLVDFLNRKRQSGVALVPAVRMAGVARFRPIILTSLTTFAGLTPLLLERSVQAQFLVPMAISLAFGVLLATVISLILVPLTYLILEDFRGLFSPSAGLSEG